jgi:hypothetical protein
MQAQLRRPPISDRRPSVVAGGPCLRTPNAYAMNRVARPRLRLAAAVGGASATRELVRAWLHRTPSCSKALPGTAHRPLDRSRQPTGCGSHIDRAHAAVGPGPIPDSTSSPTASAWSGAGETTTELRCDGPDGSRRPTQASGQGTLHRRLPQACCTAERLLRWLAADDPRLASFTCQ